jgi:hypothetical protein
MYKAIVLVAALCATLVAASERDTKINNRFALTVARRDALRQKYNLGRYAKKTVRLSEDLDGDGVEDEVTTTDSGNEPTGLINCAKGLTAGLQFS